MYLLNIKIKHIFKHIYLKGVQFLDFWVRKQMQSLYPSALWQIENVNKAWKLIGSCASTGHEFPFCDWSGFTSRALLSIQIAKKENQSMSCYRLLRYNFRTGVGVLCWAKIPLHKQSKRKVWRHGGAKKKKRKRLFCGIQY